MADLDCGQPWAADESLTNVKIHQLFDNTTVDNFDRSDFVAASSPIFISSSAPTANPTPIAGTPWFDSTNALLRIYDGTDWVPWANGWVYTNNSGSSVSAGDVVVIDTANARSVKKTTTANDTDVMGVVLIGGADAAKVIVATEGKVPTVNVTGATGIGDFLYTSTTGGSCDSNSSIQTGSFARALTSTAGSGTVSAVLGGAGLVASTTGFKWEAHDLVSFSRTNTSTGNQTVSHSLGVLPKLIMCLTRNSCNNNNQAVGYACMVDSTIKGQAVGAVGCGRNGNIGISGYSFAGGNPDMSNYARGSITAVTASDFTVNWSNVGSPSSSTNSCRAILLA